MHIHNVMEDIIYEKVNKLFDEAKELNEKWLTCSCLQCRLDTMCYVLNRVKPRYIKSGRGFAHFLNAESGTGGQIMADISALVVEGMHKVLETQRPHGDNSCEKGEPKAVFNFPAINGKILNGSNFNAMEGVSVTLKLDNEVVPQMDILWDNPYTTSEKTPGTYIFCPKPIEADELGEKRTFRFLLTGEKEGFETANMAFELELEAEEKEVFPLQDGNFFENKDMFLFDKSAE